MRLAQILDLVLERLLNYSETDAILNKSFILLNEMLKSEDLDIVNIAVVEIFEAIAGSKKALMVTEKLLDKDGIYWLNEIKKDFDAE